MKEQEQAEPEPRSREARIESLEIAQEEAEAEINFIDVTIQKLNSISDELPRSTARQSIEQSIAKMKQEKDIAEQIKAEIEQSIEFVKLN